MMREKTMMTRFTTVAMAVIVAVAMVVVGTAVEVSAASKGPSKVTITSVKSVDYNAVKVTWKKAKNAKKYEVYRATSKNGSYKKVKTTTARSYTNTKLVTGKKYYYKVRAVNGKKKGSFSTKKYAVPKLKKTTGVKVVAGSKSIKVSWSKVSGAKGYQVYRAVGKDGSYKKVKTTTGISYTDSNVKAGKNYYYKVRAYRVVNGNNRYGLYGGTKSGTLSKPKVEPSKPVTPDKPAHTHKWVAVYGERTVYEERDVYEEQEKYGRRTVCKTCGFMSANGQEVMWHVNDGDCRGYYTKDVVIGTELVKVGTEKVAVGTESYIIGYKCSCGAVKSK